MSERSNASAYASIMASQAVDPPRFLMVGNSLRSDVLPALEAGARAAHIPYQLTWAHEVVAADAVGDARFASLASISELPRWIEEHAGL